MCHLILISYRIDKLWDDRINCFVTEDIAMQSSLKTDRNYFTMKAHNKLDRFSFERRKVTVFASTTLHDWLKKLAPLFHPVISKTII